MATTTSSSPFLDYLKESVQLFHSSNNHNKRFQFVIGNEAGDADSIISALAYAYVLQQQQASDRTVIPIVSIPRADLLTQRPETTLLLELAGIKQQEDLPLIFVDELTSAKLSTSSPQETLVTLVDHNQMSDSLKTALSEWNEGGEFPVVEILDHHVDLRQYLDTCPDDDGSTKSKSRRHIAFQGEKALVASTCTLVVELWLKHQKEGSEIRLAPSISLLLLGTILLDSVNLSPKAGKVTDRDIQAVQDLLQYTDWTGFKNTMTQDRIFVESDKAAPFEPNGTRLFEALQNAKFDAQFWNSLSVRDALRLDYKSFPLNSNDFSLGISTVLVSWQDFMKKPNIWTQLQAYLAEQGQGTIMLAVMCAFTSSDSSSNALQRELILVAMPEHAGLVYSLTEALVKEDHEPPYLELSEQLPIDDAQAYNALTVHWFRQNATKASRKQVAPVLVSLLNEKLHSS